MGPYARQRWSWAAGSGLVGRWAAAATNNESPNEQPASGNRRSTGLEVVGRINEDWIPVLRIQRVLDKQSEVLFDIEAGHDCRTVEDTIDEVGSEHLDLVLDLTGDD